MQTKDIWDLESAMQILASGTVDAKTWSEAVEWLILNGPQEIRDMLLTAASAATNTAFPNLKPSHFTPDGQACYDVGELAKCLGISREAAEQTLREKLADHGTDLMTLDDDDTSTVH